MTAQAEAGAHDLTITRTFDAPAAQVFRVWEEREHLLRWWGPKDFTCTHFELDFRPGGAWRACIVSDAHGESWMRGVYREIERGRRIVFSFAWEGGRDEPDVETLVTVGFEERDGRTVQTFHQPPFKTEEGRDSHASGWDECFDREAGYLSEVTT